MVGLVMHSIHLSQVERIQRREDNEYRCGHTMTLNTMHPRTPHSSSSSSLILLVLLLLHPPTPPHPSSSPPPPPLIMTKRASKEWITLCFHILPDGRRKCKYCTQRYSAAASSGNLSTHMWETRDHPRIAEEHSVPKSKVTRDREEAERGKKELLQRMSMQQQEREDDDEIISSRRARILLSLMILPSGLLCTHSSPSSRNIRKQQTLCSLTPLP
jgi:hypothetical protein